MPWPTVYHLQLVTRSIRQALLIQRFRDVCIIGKLAEKLVKGANKKVDGEAYPHCQRVECSAG